MPMDVNILREIMRQRAGLPPGDGQTPGSPPQGGPGGPAPGGQPLQPSGPPPGTMSQEPLAQVQKSQPNEATLIIKGLVNRLRSLPGGIQPNGQSTNP